MGYFIEHVANLLLIWKLHKQKSIYGVSIQSQICLFAATLGRVMWFTDTKLPDMTLAWVEISTALVLHAYILYLCFKYKDSLYKEPPFQYRASVLISVAALLALFLHPGKPGRFFVTQQMFVSFNMFTEALSLISQL